MQLCKLNTVHTIVALLALFGFERSFMSRFMSRLALTFILSPKNAPQLFTINKRPKVNSTHFLLFSRVHEILSKLACQSVCPLVSFSIHPSMTFANSSFNLPIYKDIFK